MNDEMNFEFELREQFKREAPELPESLKKENVIAMLEKNKATPKKKKKHIFAKVIAVAAAFAVVFASVYALPLIIPEKGLTEAFPEKNNFVNPPEYEVIDNGLKATKLMQAKSAEDLKNHFLRIHRENAIDDFIDSAVDINFALFGAKAENAADGAMPESYNQAVSSVVPATTAAALADSLIGYADNELKVEENFGKTNTQVENVDEADIIKNDGKYIYILAGGAYKVERRVTILSASEMKVASYIEMDDNYYYNIQEMFVNGNRLVLLANEYEKYEDDGEDGVIYDRPYPYSYNKGQVVSFVYDISDRENPVLVRKVTQDGSEYISSRMIDGVLYTVSSYRVRGNSEDEIKENAIPDVNGEEIKCDCIYIYDYDSKSYIILSAYDTKLDNGEVNSLSILGSGREVYCSQDALYVAGTQYDYDKGDATEIYSFNLNGTEISYRASGAVKGTVLNQFSLDEYEENLRIATTYYSYKHDVDVSNIYVLNKDLQLIGQLEDIAYDEQVKSVRFMGNVGYIVTFRNTDPLFTLDLSDPVAPKIVGEVKLPGFSSYLHPVSEGLVVGLGYDGDEENADFSSIKVSLFDVSDLKAPKEVDTFVLKNVYSPALENPKAFISYPEKMLIGFPVEHYDGRTVLSYKLLKIEDGKISSHLGYVHETERMTGDVFRGTYIGQKLYTIDNYNVCEFDIATADMLRSCEILDVEEDAPNYDENQYNGDYVVYTSPAVPPGAVVATTVSQAVTASDSFDFQTTVGVTTSSGVTAVATTTVPAVSTTTQSAEYSFEALVIKVLEGRLLVEVSSQANSGLSVGTQAYLSTDVKDCEAGDTVKVMYDGVIQESYPVQLPNVLGVWVSKD